MSLNLEKPLTVSSLAQFESEYVRPNAGRALIVGSRLYGDLKIDRRSLHREAIGVDLAEGPGVDRVLDMEGEMPSDFIDAFDHVECMSVLEHSPSPWAIAKNIEQVMRKGATLFFSVPFVWDYHPYSDDFFRFTQSGVRSLFPNIEWATLMNAHWELTESKKAGRLHIGAAGFPFHPRTEIVGFGHRK